MKELKSDLALCNNEVDDLAYNLRQQSYISDDLETKILELEDELENRSIKAETLLDSLKVKELEKLYTLSICELEEIVKQYIKR